MPATDFVRYSDDIETIDPNMDELLGQIIEFWERRAASHRRPRAPGALSAARMPRPSAWSRRRSSSSTTCLRRTRRASTPGRDVTAR